MNGISAPAAITDTLLQLQRKVPSTRPYIVYSSNRSPRLHGASVIKIIGRAIIKVNLHSLAYARTRIRFNADAKIFLSPQRYNSDTTDGNRETSTEQELQM